MRATNEVRIAMTHWPFFGDARIHIQRADGVYLYTTDGRRILDAAGGAIAVNVGHGRARVANAIAHAAHASGYVVPPWLTPEREALAEELIEHWLPPELTNIHITTGGSDANEAAFKMALQYHAAHGDTARTKIIVRHPSYHGTTLSTTAASGHPARQRGLEHALTQFPSTPAPYPLRTDPEHHNALGAYYAAQFEETLLTEDPRTVAAFVAEPITGSSGGALVPPDDYWPRVREICDRHGVLLIMDEVMTGFGRTGAKFAFEHWGTVPDILTAGKGLAGGYAPIGGVYARAAIADALAEQQYPVMFHTLAAHPTACAAAVAVLRLLRSEELIQRCVEQGEKLQTMLIEALAGIPQVAEIRGRGLLQAVEVVADPETLEPYAESTGMTQRIVSAGLKRGVFYYMGGTGDVRDILCIGPPFTITDEQLQTVASTLADSVADAVAQV